MSNYMHIYDGCIQRRQTSVDYSERNRKSLLRGRNRGDSKGRQMEEPAILLIKGVSQFRYAMDMLVQLG